MALFKKLIFLICPLIIFCFLITPKTKAVDNCPSGYSAQQCVDFYNQKLGDTKNKENTLSSQIAKMENEIALTKAQISLTEDKLLRVADDISSASAKITNLETALTHTSEVLVNRIVTTYKQGITDPFLITLTSNNVNELTQKLVYLQIAQKHDKAIMEDMALSKKNYKDQKDLLIQKQKEVEDLRAQLKKYQTQLTAQKAEEQRLLAVTKNDEATYQQLLAQAKAQLEAFGNFVTGQGGFSLLSGQTSCNDWGCYYNQRDSSWGLMGIGHSRDTLAEYGCLVTSSAMVLSHYGHKVTPAQVATTYEAFFADTAYMLLSPWHIDGVTFTRTNYGRDMGKLDSELKDGHPVIIGIGSGPSHFIVFKSKDGDDYIMNDPYFENGKDLKFTSKYSKSSISVVNVVRVN